MNEKPLALLYARVSTGRQADTGHSLDSQPVILTQAAQAAGFRVEVLTETGSGRRASRPVLSEALDRLKHGEAQALYAVDIDRLARSTQHLLEIANAAKRQGWRLVITSADGIDTASPAGELALTVYAAAAQFESRMISERVKRQHEARRARGEVWGVTAGCRSALPVEVRERIVREHEAGASLRAIANGLIADGIPTARGGVWAAATVRAILSSPASQAA